MLSQYTITWTTDDGSAEMSVTSDKLSVTITDLVPCQTYRVTVAGVTGVGTGSESDPVTEQTEVASEGQFFPLLQ